MLKRPTCKKLIIPLILKICQRTLKMKHIHTFILLLIFLVFSVSAYAQIRVNTALCENKINPFGINLQDIIFSWEMQSNENAVAQTAYQLVISSSKKQLDAGKYDVYNSGIVKSNQSIQVQYKGKKLQSAQTYYWKVCVWDNKNKPSKWSEAQKFTTGLFSEKDWNNAKWIGYEDMHDSMRVVPFMHVLEKHLKDKYVRNAISPLLRKEFNVSKKVKKALLFVSGLGQYEASLNGTKIGNAFLSPGWTYYDKTVLYNTYDITEQLLKGKNTIGVILGNGFYNVSHERYYKIAGMFGKPKMISMLKITYTDGTNEDIISDKSWTTTSSPITFNNIYGGENYDARLEQKGWNTNSFNDKTWKQIVTVNPPLGKLLPEIDYPVVLLDTFSVKKVWQPEKGVYMYDFGQDVSGILQLKIKGKAGQTVKLIPCELLNNKQLANQNIAGPYYYTYTLKGDKEEVWQPKFTYFAIRYVQVEGAVPDSVENPLELSTVVKLKLIHNRNSSPANGSFSCSNELFNRINKLIDWAIKSNLQSVITDNPQREKLSWQGEQNFMRESINYGYDVYNLYRSLVINLMDSQYQSGLVPDIAPEYVKFPGAFADTPEWGSTSILDIWFLYKYYGDKAMIEKAYSMMKKYAKYLESKAEGNILNYGLNDWLDVGPNHRSPAGLTPLGITATAFYYYSINSLSQMALMIGNKNDTDYYGQLAERIKITFNDKFFNKETKVYGTGSQTAMAMALSIGLVEEQYKKDVLSNLVNSISANGKVLTAGDVGHRFLVNALNENGQSQLLFDMTNRDDVPGYGYQLRNGATALTETWEGSSSNNQLAMGHILEWFYCGIGGISQEENSVAFKHIKIRPQPVGDLTYAKCRFHSPYGWITTDWKKESDLFTLKVQIPVNTNATIYLPATISSKIYCNGKIVTNKKILDNMAVFSVESGNYELTVKL